MTNIFSKSVNTIRCIGTLNEIKVIIEKKDNKNIIKCNLILEINGQYVPFRFYTTKSFQDKYYSMLECLGIQYSDIRLIDNDKYTLDESLISCGLSGSIKIIDNNIEIKTIKIPIGKQPTKLFIIAKVNEYGFNIDYISRTDNVSYLDIDIKGLVCGYKNNVLSVLIKDNDDYPCKVDLTCSKEIFKNIDKKSLCSLKCVYMNCKMRSNAVIEVFSKPLIAISSKNSNDIFDNEEIKELSKEYQMISDMRANRTLK